MFRRRQRDTEPNHSSVAGDDVTAPRAAEAPNAEADTITVLQRGSVVTGNLQAPGRVVVNGSLLGDVVAAGRVEVGVDGSIEGDSVRAAEIVILGRVRADVEVSGVVEVWDGGRLEGDVRAAALDIEPGATFIGRSEMLRGDEHLASSADADADAATTSGDAALSDTSREVAR